MIDVIDETIIGSTISPSAASFDKEASKQQDIEVTVQWNDNKEVSRISNGGHDLVPLTDYTVNGNIIRIHKSYLADLPNGTAQLTLTFPAGPPQQLVLTVQDTTVQDSRVYPPVISFDRNERLASDPADVNLTLALNGNALTSVATGGTTRRRYRLYGFSCSGSAEEGISDFSAGGHDRACIYLYQRTAATCSRRCQRYNRRRYIAER